MHTMAGQVTIVKFKSAQSLLLFGLLEKCATGDVTVDARFHIV